MQEHIALYLGIVQNIVYNPKKQFRT